MNEMPDFKPIYEVCEGVGTQAAVLFSSDDSDEAIDWARQRFRVTRDVRLLVRFDEFQPSSGLFRPRIVWRARGGLAEPGPAMEIRSTLTGRLLREARRR